MSDRSKGPTPRDAPVLLRLNADERLRLKVAAVECGQSYQAFVMDAVVAHEKRKLRRTAIERSPLHGIDP